MGINPNELFSGFKDKMMEMTSPNKSESGINVNKFSNQKPFAMYPSDILSPNSEVTKAIQFSALKYTWKKKEASEKSKGFEGGGNIDESQHVWSCFLPIPAISTSDGHEYSQFNGWGMGEAISQLPSAAKDIAKAFSNPSGENALQALNSASNTVAPIAVKSAYEFIKGTFGDAFNVARRNIWDGAAINPLTSIIYENSALKEYQFNFVFVARNRKETDSIHEIITSMQRLSRPSAGKAQMMEDLGLDIHVDYLAHPCLWQIKFIGVGTEQGSDISKYLPKIKTCAMTNIQIAYQAEGSPVFFRSSAAPMVYVVAMVFKELYISTQEDV